MVEKIIRDPIHGNIVLEDFFIKLLDVAQMQRLRNIKQNGLCYLVYPSMNSTRFEHSLGVYHLASRISKHLRLEKQDADAVKAAALLHDIGHGPFSHTFDVVFSRHGFNHEDRSEWLIHNTDISAILMEAGVDPQGVSDLIHGVGKLGKIISSEVDVDKMDYLVRDAYYAGVAYGITDVERLLYSICLEKKDVIVDAGGLEAAESLLINRNMMHQTVYRHHTKRIAESMMSHGLSVMIDVGEDQRKLWQLDDIGLTSLMRAQKGYARDMIDAVESRRLFKMVFSEKICLLDDNTNAELKKDYFDVGKRMAQDLGITQGMLLVDYPETSMSTYRVKVRTDGGLSSILDISSLAKSLADSEREKLNVQIYVEKGQASKFRNFRPERYLCYEQKRISEYT